MYIVNFRSYMYTPNPLLCAESGCGASKMSISLVYCDMNTLLQVHSNIRIVGMQAKVGFSFVSVPLSYFTMLYSEGSNLIASVKLSVISCPKPRTLYHYNDLTLLSQSVTMYIWLIACHP